MNVQMADQSGLPSNTKPWQLALKTLELISFFGCQPSPKAYEVFFAHAGGNQVVRDQVAKAAGTQQLLTSFDLDRIHHDNFRTNDGEWEQQQRASHKVEACLGATAEGLASHVKIGEAYERKLVSASGKISSTKSPEHLSELLDTLINETGSVRSATAAMRSNLLAARDEVTEVTAGLASTRQEGAKDLLTGLTGQRAFDIRLDTAVDTAIRNGEQLLVCVVSLDNFDQINERYGRLTGDAAIRSVGRMIGRFATGRDLVARIGGVTFALLMQGCSSREAYTSAEAIRNEIAGRVFNIKETGDTVETLTASVGLGVLAPGDAAQTLLARARGCVEAAQKTGGNRTDIGSAQIL